MKQGASRVIFGLSLLLIGAATPEALKELWPSPPPLQFLGPAGRTTITVGEPVTVHYADVLRNELCHMTIAVRWRTVTAEGAPGPLVAGLGGETFEAVIADMGVDAVDFSARLDAVATPPPGDWFYAPLAKPGRDCGNRDVLVVPPHRVTVLP